MHNRTLLLKDSNKNPELLAFDQLPTELRIKINYAEERLDPRQILGIFKTQGLNQALSYIAATHEEHD